MKDRADDKPLCMDLSRAYVAIGLLTATCVSRSCTGLVTVVSKMDLYAIDCTRLTTFMRETPLSLVWELGFGTW